VGVEQKKGSVPPDPLQSRILDHFQVRIFPMKQFALSSVALGTCLGAWLAGPAALMPRLLAQAKGDPASGMLLPPVNFQTNQDESRAFLSMRKGETPASGAEAKRILDDAAKWYAYRFTHLDYQQPKSPSKGMQALRQEAMEQILDPHGTGKALTSQQQAYADEFGKLLTARLHEVADNNKVIVRMNAAMVLAKLAATGREEAADALVEILRKPQESDAVKLYALRGLKGIFSLGAGGNIDAFRDKEREIRCIQALLDYLGERWKFPPGQPPDEAAASQIIRMDAIQALGRTRFPAYAKLVGKKHELERLTALALVRVLAKDGLVPEPSLKEQVSAAVGLCQLQPQLCKEYQPDYAAYYIGRFVVDFIQAYNQARQKEEKREPWKKLAMTLSQALNAQKTDLEGPPAHEAFQYFSKMQGQAERLLQEVLDGKTNPVPTDLSDWLDKNPPKATSAYKDLPTAVVSGEKHLQ
jgi:hypothetical protein